MLLVVSPAIGIYPLSIGIPPAALGVAIVVPFTKLF
jgi:hypothetical protein